MLRKAIITLATFFFAGVVVFGAVAAASPAVASTAPCGPTPLGPAGTEAAGVVEDPSLFVAAAPLTTLVKMISDGSATATGVGAAVA